MPATLEKVDSVRPDAVHEALRVRDSSRPDACCDVTERLRLADADEGLTTDIFNQGENPSGKPRISFNPVAKVFDEVAVENQLAGPKGGRSAATAPGCSQVRLFEIPFVTSKHALSPRRCP